MTDLDVIVGSNALLLWGLANRKPKDVDVITTDAVGSIVNGKPDCFCDERLNPFIDAMRQQASGTGSLRVIERPSLDFLYTLKLSHSYWDLPHGKWEKHIGDLIVLKRAGAVLWSELHAVLYQIWEEKYGKKQVNLYMDKAAFFDDAVKRIYDHDSIHRAVAYGDWPLYETVLVPGQEIAQSTKAIKALDKVTRDRLYREEIYVTALERWILPKLLTSPRAAYNLALKKMITSLSKGWSATYILDNIPDFLEPEIDYVGRCLSNQDRLELLGEP
jgi:hypothetical protein